MGGLVLMTFIIGSIAFPLLAGREESIGRTLRKAIGYALALNVVYVLAVRFIYPRL
jgi:hypothetical protein